MEEMEELYNKRFEDIKHTDENGVEFWYARELMKVLKYSKWENFKKVIRKAMDGKTSRRLKRRIVICLFTRKQWAVGSFAISLLLMEKTAIDSWYMILQRINIMI